ncbi:hypothetical protein CGMCC3_g10645 [Colletotrichum fructicola]|nr:uncharacterized protein CGMCC3_g10645 [Colletotrichum fructicola]KAE9573350.1 hypothetical protein CGMCC3_g10645 [Colletotrichum fructicola]
MLTRRKARKILGTGASVLFIACNIVFVVVRINSTKALLHDRAGITYWRQCTATVATVIECGGHGVVMDISTS